MDAIHGDRQKLAGPIFRKRTISGQVDQSLIVPESRIQNWLVFGRPVPRHSVVAFSIPMRTDHIEFPIMRSSEQSRHDY